LIIVFSELKKLLLKFISNFETCIRFKEHLTFGSRGDSFYEILLKQWRHTGKKNLAIKVFHLFTCLSFRKFIVNVLRFQMFSFFVCLFFLLLCEDALR
jgi:hypothetical protein